MSSEVLRQVLMTTFPSAHEADHHSTARFHKCDTWLSFALCHCSNEHVVRLLPTKRFLLQLLPPLPPGTPRFMLQKFQFASCLEIEPASRTALRSTAGLVSTGTSLSPCGSHCPSTVPVLFFESTLPPASFRDFCLKLFLPPATIGCNAILHRHSAEAFVDR